MDPTNPHADPSAPDPVEAMAYSVLLLTCIILSFVGLACMCHYKYTRRNIDDIHDITDVPEQHRRYAQPPPPPTPPVVVPVHVAVISQPDGEYALGLRTRVDKKISE